MVTHFPTIHCTRRTNLSPSNLFSTPSSWYAFAYNRTRPKFNTAPGPMAPTVLDFEMVMADCRGGVGGTVDHCQRDVEIIVDI